MERRVSRFEESMTEVKEAQEAAESYHEQFDSMEENVSKTMQKLLDETFAKLNERDDSLEATVVAMKKEMDQLKSELLIYKTAMQSGVLGEVAAPKPKIDVPKPKEFNGTRTVQDVENFIWGLEQYF